MLRLFAFLWSGCWHKWETIEVLRNKWSNDFGSHGVGLAFHERCERCGVNRLRRSK